MNMKKVSFLCIALCVALLASCAQKQGPSEEEIQKRIDDAVAAKLAELGIDQSNIDATNGNAETQTKYAYEFAINGISYRLTVDLEEETAQLYVKGGYAPDGKTFYGASERYFDKPSVLCTKGFSGADDFDITIKGERSFWENFQYIDTKTNYLYTKIDYFQSKNPDYRIELKPVK